MEPDVPFPLLAGVELIAVAAALGLAAAACAPRLRRRTTPLVVLGGVVLAVAEAATANAFGHPDSDWLMLLRAAGYLLIAAGLAGGALRRFATQPAYGVVVPLGAGAPAAALACGMALAAAVAALQVAGRFRRPLLVAAFAL